MKQIIKSLAVLAVAASATIISSCNKTEKEQLPADRTASLTIAPPKADLTKVTTIKDGTTAIQITGWAEEDVIKLVKHEKGESPIVAEFICVDTDKGNFRGNLPEGINDINEFQYAFYNVGSIKMDPINGDLEISHDKKKSSNPKELIMLFGKRDDKGDFQMEVVNNILKIVNPGDPINVAVKGDDKTAIELYNIVSSDGHFRSAYIERDFSTEKFPLNTGTTFIWLPGGMQIGLGQETDADDAASIAPFKNLADKGKIYTLTLPAPVIPEDSEEGSDGSTTISDCFNEGAYLELVISHRSGDITIGGSYHYGVFNINKLTINGADCLATDLNRFELYRELDGFIVLIDGDYAIYWYPELGLIPVGTCDLKSIKVNGVDVTDQIIYA